MVVTIILRFETFPVVMRARKHSQRLLESNLVNPKSVDFRENCLSLADKIHMLIRLL